VRILLLEKDYRQCGGSEAMVMEVAGGLAAKGHAIFLAHQFGGHLLERNQSMFQGTACVNLQPFGWRKLGATLKTVWTLRRLVRKWKIDVIFSSHLGYIRSLALLQAFACVPFAYHLGLGPPAPNRLNRWALKRLGAGISPSTHNGHKWLDAGLSASQLQIVSNWVDGEKFNPQGGKTTCREKLKITHLGPVVVYVGRIVPEKGVESLLRAFSNCVQENPDAFLLMVGAVAQEFASYLNQLIRELGLRDDQIHLAGHSSDPQFYFGAADVAVVPSIVEESFGLTAVEAMACGTLTLVSDSGELPNLVGEENQDLIFPRGDAPALAAQLEHWLAKPEAARQRGLKLRERVLEKFQAPDKLNHYETILIGLTKR
jgi:glycosyltransferase involved in cell wall biosynthesis